MEVRLFCWLYVYSGMRERACWSYLRCYGCADVVTHRLTDSCPKSGSDWKSYYGTEFSANSVAKQDADIEPNIESDGSTNVNRSTDGGADGVTYHCPYLSSDLGAYTLSVFCSHSEPDNFA